MTDVDVSTDAASASVTEPVDPGAYAAAVRAARTRRPETATLPPEGGS